MENSKRTEKYKSSCLSSEFKRVSYNRRKWIIRFNVSYETSESGVEFAVYDEMVIYFYPEYDKIVSSLINSEYSVNDEIAINRQKDEKPEEWAKYYEFCENMKNEAKLIISDYKENKTDSSLV